MPISVGVARKYISPPIGVYLIGYGERAKGNIGIDDDLTATALALDDGLHRVVIVACDLLAINEHTVARIQAQTGSNVLICCSHTHSGPITYARQHAPQRDREYISYMVKQIVNAVKESIANLQPAQLSWAQGEADIAVNRRERKPDGQIDIGVNLKGPIDRSLSIVQAQTPEGQPIVTLVNFQCHGTVLGPENLLVSADWIGAMRKKVEQWSGAPVMFLQGATGDLNPDHEWDDDDFRDVERIGLRVAERVEKTLHSLEPISGSMVSFQQEQVWLALDAEARGQVPPPTYKEVLARMARVPRFLVDFVLNHRYPWKTHIADRGGYWSVPVVLTHILAGELAIYGLGAEVFTEIGMQIKEISPARHTIFASLSSGCIGYLPTSAEHALGGYEVDLAPYFYRMPGKLNSGSAKCVLEAVRRISTQDMQLT